MRRMLCGPAARLVLAGLMLAACSSNPPPAPDGGPDAGGTDVPTTTDVPRADVPSTTDTAVDVPASNSCGAGRGACDPVTNMGCGSGQACVSAGTSYMCTAAGTHGFGEICTSAADCRERMACLIDPTIDGGMTGRCRKLCCGTDDFETCRDTAQGGLPGANCSTQIGDGMGGGSGIYACNVPVRCDYLGQTGCASNQVCIPSSAAGDTDCIPAGTVAVGGDCSAANAFCVSGALCINTDSGAVCAQICRRGAAPDGGAGPTCTTGTCQGVNMTPADFGVCR